MKKALVVYFSRSGYTRCVAEQIASALGADCEAIQEPLPRTGWRGYWRSAREALRGRLADIGGGSLHPQDYELVVLGTPVWAGNMSSPVRAYITRHREELPAVALFCTQGGSGAPKVLQKMAELCGRRPVATAFYNDKDIHPSQTVAGLESFLTALADWRP